GNGVRIAIDGDHVGAGFDQSLAVAASAERAVNHGFPGQWPEGSQDIGEKNRNVASRSAIGIAPVARHHSVSPRAPGERADCRKSTRRARTACACALSRPGPQIWKKLPRPTKATSPPIPVWARMKSVIGMRPSW